MGDQAGQVWYCDDSGMFNIEQRDVLDDIPADYDGEPAYYTLQEGRCTLQNGNKRTINRNKSAWAPYMRTDGKCFYAHFKGKHKCYVTRTQNYRLCGCQEYSDLFGEEYEKNPSIVPVDADTGRGWYQVSDKNCNNFCSNLGLKCDEDVMDDFKGAYDMMELEKLDTDGAMDLCDMYDDRLEKKKNPNYRETDKHCYVNNPNHGGKASCNLKSRDDDFRWCYCNDN